MPHSYWVYMVTDKPYGTLYIGVTNNLARRTDEHASGKFVGFTKRYSLKQLVYYEEYQQVDEAITREKKLKKWRRAWKLDLIKGFNPEWRDLGKELHK
ncbi:MAG: GIY-YIG nuclease family protein [Bdellovibrionales bacterium]